MKIYIAGPITGIMDYRKKFKKAEKRLQKAGHIVINPSNLPMGLDDYMPICKAMIDQADAVYFLNDWDKSVGALEEHKYAISVNKKMFFESKKVHNEEGKMLLQALAENQLQSSPNF